MVDRLEQISQIIVTAQQMRDIEARIFAAGMPVAALMEKVAGLISRKIQVLYSNLPRVGILAGPGHNGGDALVVARELHFCGYDVKIYSSFSKLKELTWQHLQYAQSLGIPCYESIEELSDCDFLIDGLFGFGLERRLQGAIAKTINQVNSWSKLVISIDLPSGLHTDTGEVLGTAIRATQTFCLGLWKLGLFQDDALEYIGKAELIDFDIPLADVQAVVGDVNRIHRITQTTALSTLPLPRPAVTHKYKEGHLLLICGSRRYSGGAILTGLGARVSGVGMLSIAVPESLKPLLVAQLPEALIIGCPETQTGAIASLQLPKNTDLSSFDAIACGPGLTGDSTPIIQQVLESDRSLILDADALNILAQMATIPTLQKRQAVTILTPHAGEFKRLFPDVSDAMKDRVRAVREAALHCGAIVLLKGARTAIANSQNSVWINPESTPALARGGSGDVLTGVLGGLLAQAKSKHISVEQIVATAAWWHSQAGILAAEERTELGVDAFTLTNYFIPVLASVGKN
ncbi:bifunctional ADP-dependent NAD(P)H-hydrate dehydratase/NAD(P)H-hydrate epimerase [Scytonema hofmannii FACHB-248]|uniref:Bifunctional NAD(P)H-hydrate repair enzyme n=1 Tax=Scytonema hofmannii FACHB-248 TaxID=1842502 RepID=A0ABR8GQS1_9CYAN|nr:MULTISPECIES: bifunctional ADP-dependent NAD(P)H-hydrate dehydratase/NAD(P)H-hydrate epimerase [Nostocales]MBD2605301.1 bifunctional ADP-dependent NAD(P)H-hydrate dehydratase/NAD(P)H-hydrate epimerase [Scytonema hofmannii FACHB-248]